MLKCQPGTYQDKIEKGFCNACPAGSYCPTSGMSTHTPCLPTKANYYCPAGTIEPKKCPPGKYASADTKTCTDCPKGKYCWPCPAGQYCFSKVEVAGHSGIAGDCDVSKGFVCRLGSHSPEPTYDGYELILPNSIQFSTYSGPVVRGYLADKSGALTACAKGTF